MRASRSVVILAAAAVWAAAPAAAMAGSGPTDVGPTPVVAELTTPELLAAAVADGTLTQMAADSHLAAALAPGARKLPDQFRSDAPWDGTVPLLHLRQRVARMPRSASRSALEQSIDAAALSTATCSSSTTPLLNTTNSTNFTIDYSTISGGLAIGDYVTSLETSWGTEVTSFGWAAPPVKPSNPPPGNRYHVRIESLGSGLYGFVAGGGTYAGPVGDNPSTPWPDGDARASCMVLNNDYSAFPGSAQQALDATTAHEFNHSIQFGYGALDGNVPDDAFIEGGATWMEDEVMDAANDNYNYLWPTFTDSLGDYDASPYPYWIVFRGITERFGAGTPGGGEQVMQAFWETISQNAGSNVAAFATAVTTKGVTLADAYHDTAIATRFNRTCGGGYVLPRCFEEAAGYLAAAGPNPSTSTISSAGGSASGSLEDDYSLNWVSLPASGGAYNVTLANTSGGGTLRGSVVCDTGSALVVSPLPSTVSGGGSSTLSSFNPAGCAAVVAVLTNQTQSAVNPTNPPTRAYTLSTASAGGGGGPTVSIRGTTVTEHTGATVSAKLAVTLSAPSTGTVRVRYATSPGSAGSLDFTAKSGTLTFNPGQTSKSVTVKVQDDTLVEGTETFTVTLSSPSGAVLGTATATVTILDND